MPSTIESASFLRQRVAAATQKDVLLGMFLESSFTHLADLQGREASEVARRRILGNKSLVSFFRYPLTDLLKLLNMAVPEGSGEQVYADTIEGFGRAAVRIFFESPVGKTMLVLGAASPHRLLAAAPSGYRAVSSFGERSTNRLSDTTSEMTYKNELLGAAWSVGVTKQALEMVCQVKPSIEAYITNSSGSDFVLKIGW